MKTFILFFAAGVMLAVAEEPNIVRPERDTFNYENAVVFNPETKRFEKFSHDRYIPQYNRNNDYNRRSDGRYNSYTGKWEPDYYGRYNPYTKRYEQDDRWFNPATGRYEYDNNRRFNPSTGRYDYDYQNRYNPTTGRYDYDDGRRYYNPQTGRFEYEYLGRYNATTGKYENEYNRRYNPATGRYEYDYLNLYNPATGQYDYNYDRYTADPNFGRKYAKEFYGVGSVERVHVPKVRYDNEQHWKTLRDVRKSDDDGYHYSYETQNAIRAAEDAHVINKGTSHQALAKTGFYEYVGDDGKTYRVDYVADENGFHAQGAHLPTPPPIPEAIQRSLDYIAKAQKNKKVKA